MTQRQVEDQQEREIIRAFAVQDHKTGERPFATDLQEITDDDIPDFEPEPPKPEPKKKSASKPKEVCRECQGTGKCMCVACHHQNKGNCLFCNPSASVKKWRAYKTYQERLGPPPVEGAETHTPTQRYISYLPEVFEKRA